MILKKLVLTSMMMMDNSLGSNQFCICANSFFIKFYFATISIFINDPKRDIYNKLLLFNI